MQHTGLIDRFARHRVAANLAMLMMVLGGLWAARHVPLQLDPAIDFPIVQIEVEWPGAGAEDVAHLVTTPIEQALRSQLGIAELTSRSGPGQAIIQAEFTHDVDMSDALDQVRQRVDAIRNLPADLEPPRVYRLVDTEPVTEIRIRGTGELDQLIPLARRFDRELRARGIAAIRFDGLPERELAIRFPSERLIELGTTLDELGNAVAERSRDVPAGTVGLGQGSRQLRSLDQQRSVGGFEDLELEIGGSVRRLGDVAEIGLRAPTDSVRVTHDGHPVIAMTTFRHTDADALEASRVVDAWLAATRPTLPAGVTLETGMDVWGFLGAQLGMIGSNALSGLVLVIATLFVFLSGRVGFWVTMGIPVSFLAALAVYWGEVFDGGINILAILGFVMALGIVVDDAIVVGEDATSHFEAGADPHDAAVAGARRMFVPVLTSSLTTLAAFGPLLLVGGIMGDFVLTLPMVLLCIIVASLVECFLVLPGHLGAAFRAAGRPAVTGFRARFDAAFTRWRDGRFARLLARALDRPGTTVAIAVAAMTIAIGLVASGRVGVRFVTGMDFESLEADVEFAASATEAERSATLAQLEAALEGTREALGANNAPTHLVRTHLAWFDNERKTGTQYASVRVDYALEEKRSATPAEFLAAWRERVQAPPWAERLELRVEGGANGGRPDIEIVLRGRDARALKHGAEELTRALAGYAGVTESGDDLPWGGEQLVYSLTPSGRALGLTPDDLGRQLRTAYSGRRVQIYNDDDTETEVRVMLPDDERRDLALLARFPVRTPTGTMVPLGNVAELVPRRGLDTIRHADGNQAIRVTAAVDPRQGNAFRILEDVRENVLPDLLARHDLEWGVGGMTRQNQMLLDTLALGAVLTLILIYLVLAWVFASWSWPIAIMTAIPFGLTGAIVGHFVMGMELGAMTLLALFALTGIVVNDSIVLISFFRRHVDNGVAPREAIEQAATARLRAVLLTSLTTIAGLAPLMFETSSLAMYIAPIAVTICFGLAFGTALVLLVVPALLLLVVAAGTRIDAARAALGDRIVDAIAAFRGRTSPPRSTVPENRA